MTTATAVDVRCPDCHEPIRHRAGQGWLHERTNDKRCQPLCQCGKRAKHRLGYHGFDGASARFITTGWVCDACKPKGLTEWT